MTWYVRLAIFQIYPSYCFIQEGFILGNVFKKKVALVDEHMAESEALVVGNSNYCIVLILSPSHPDGLQAFKAFT